MLQDNFEKMKVETYVWVNKDDPSMYGEWDFEVCFFFVVVEWMIKCLFVYQICFCRLLVLGFVCVLGMESDSRGEIRGDV